MNTTVLEISKILSHSRRNQENYKSLRANIEFAGDSPRTILVTSSIPGEGKSFVSCNLANEIAKNGNKVLLLDCDLRKSQHAKNLGVNAKEMSGLTEILKGKESINNCMFSTDVKGLYMIFAGSHPSNPSELLNSERFVKVLDNCKNVFDYIILDSPPIASVIDSAVICKYCDGVVFVIGSDMVSCRIAQRAVKQLQRAGGRVLGCTLNKIRMSNRALYGTYGTNKYYYGSYSGEYVSDSDSDNDGEEE